MGFSKGNNGNGARVGIARNIKRERHVATDNMVGMIVMFAGAINDIPVGWLLCDGGEVLQTSFPTLYSLIGTTYGTASVSGYFVLPDMRDNVAIGVGSSVCTALAQEKDAVSDSSSEEFNYIGLYYIIRAY